MKIKLFLNKDVNFNANHYFEKAKKLKKKLPGIDKTIEKTEKDIYEFESKKKEYIDKKEFEHKLKVHKKKEWFEKFRFTYSSSGLLCVFGKDASSNEILIKKHMEENDLVFHTETPGSPFGIVKNSKDKISKKEILEVGEFVCSFSAQWKKGFGTADCFWVYPEQVSKKALSGEYVAKGAFMIYGKKNILKNIPLRICLGIKKTQLQVDEETFEIEELFSGSENACKKYCGPRYIKLEPGTDNYKKLTKDIKKRLKTIHLEDLPKYIPNNCKILKR